MERPLIRPMAAAEIIASAFRLFQQHVALLVLIALIPQVVLVLMEYLLREIFASSPGFLFAVVLVIIIMNAVALSAITIAVAGAVLGFPPTVLQTYSLTLRNNLFSVVAAYVMTALIISVGFTLVFAPALIFGPGPAMVFGIIPTLVLGGFLALTIPMIVLESLGPMRAITRSFAMMREELMKGVTVFGFVILISGILPLLFQFVVGGGPFAPILGAVIGSVTLPLAYTANVMLYFAMRAKEGYTEEQLEQDLTRRMQR
ncbi:MAG: hypothetical protein O7E56_14635 [SAR324 cluster bacterium]|nr:hypothetical protein [SAR324 cluster bacterium]MCZ6841432.1 hypothetical protein [SAR324 cluster bacterium]